jgi:hypothetical protein
MSSALRVCGADVWLTDNGGCGHCRVGDMDEYRFELVQGETAPDTSGTRSLLQEFQQFTQAKGVHLAAHLSSK